ncbi:unnamed protein product [Pylaiella littoralis]
MRPSSWNTPAAVLFPRYISYDRPRARPSRSSTHTLVNRFRRGRVTMEREDEKIASHSLFCSVLPDHIIVHDRLQS